MTHPLGEPLAVSAKAELLFYLRCLAHIVGGYGVTVLAALLSSHREVMGLLGITTAVIAFWLAGGMAAWLVTVFEEPFLQTLATASTAAVPFGILCGPLIRAADPNDLPRVLGSIALLLAAAGMAGMVLPAGWCRFVPWWFGVAMLLLANLLTTTVDTGMPRLAIYLCVIMLAICTAADANRAVTSMRANPRQSSRFVALVWLDTINLVRQLRTQTFKS